MYQIAVIGTPNSSPGNNVSADDFTSATVYGREKYRTNKNVPMKTLNAVSPDDLAPPSNNNAASHHQETPGSVEK